MTTQLLPFTYPSSQLPEIWERGGRTGGVTLVTCFGFKISLFPSDTSHFKPFLFTYSSLNTSLKQSFLKQYQHFAQK